MANLANTKSFVGSLSHPGGNVTGSTFDAIALNGKRLGLLREAIPGARRVAILVQSLKSKRIVRQLKHAKSVAKNLGLKIQAHEAQTLGEIESAFLQMAKERTDALIINTSAELNFHRNRIAALAIAMKLPTMCEQTAFVPAGCLMAYTVDRNHLLLRAAAFVDEILKGAKPGALPVELATRYRFLVNLNTAKEIDIKLPALILLQATEIIK